MVAVVSHSCPGIDCSHHASEQPLYPFAYGQFVAWWVKLCEFETIVKLSDLSPSYPSIDAQRVHNSVTGNMKRPFGCDQFLEFDEAFHNVIEF